MNPRFWWDKETYSPVPIKHGTHIYAEQAEVMLFAWALDDGDVFVWDRTADEVWRLVGGDAVLAYRVPDGAVPMPIMEAADDPDVEWWGHNTGMFDPGAGGGVGGVPRNWNNSDGWRGSANWNSGSGFNFNARFNSDHWKLGVHVGTPGSPAVIHPGCRSASRSTRSARATGCRTRRRRCRPR